MHSALAAYLHHLAAFSVVACLVAQHLYLSEPLTVSSGRRLVMLDLIYGISAVILVAIGFTRVFYFEKGASYYFHSIPFLVKISLALTVGLVSVIPTLEFLSWRKALSRGQAPRPGPEKMKKVVLVVRLELAAVLIILFCAALMAKAVGYFG